MSVLKSMFNKSYVVVDEPPLIPVNEKEKAKLKSEFVVMVSVLSGESNAMVY